LNIFFEHKIKNETEVSVIQINDNQQFISEYQFQNKLDFKKNTLSEKRLKEVAAQYALIAHLLNGDDFELRYEPSGRPQLWIGERQRKISISHSGDYVAVLLSDSEYYGVDVQIIKKKIKNLAHKFLNENEMNLIQGTSEDELAHLLTACWCTKETLYKMYGKGFIDYQNLFTIKNLHTDSSNKIIAEATFDNITHQFQLYVHTTEDFVLVYYS